MVLDWNNQLPGFWQWFAVQTGFQDRCDTAIGRRANTKSPTASSLQTLIRVAFAKAQDAKQGAVRCSNGRPPQYDNRYERLPFSTPHIDRDWPVKALMPVDQGNQRGFFCLAETRFYDIQGFGVIMLLMLCIGRLTRIRREGYMFPFCSIFQKRLKKLNLIVTDTDTIILNKVNFYKSAFVYLCILLIL